MISGEEGVEWRWWACDEAGGEARFVRWEEERRALVSAMAVRCDAAVVWYSERSCCCAR